MNRDPVAETAARGQRAQLTAEFLTPILDEMRETYLARMADIAVKELNPKVRAEKITALSIALKIRDNVANGLNSAIEAGRMAERSVLNAQNIERMGKHDRRLFDIVGQR